MPAITDAATLLIELKKTGTGEGKLELIRDLLTANPEATAEEAINAMANTPSVTQRTLQKAMQLAEHGQVVVVQEAKKLAVEEQILERRKLAAVVKQKEAVLDKLATEFSDSTAPDTTPPDNPVPPPVQIGASVPEEVTNQPSAAGPGKVETIRETTPVKNPSKKS